MKSILFYMLSSLLLLSACFKKEDQELEIENYNADWAAQVINSEFNISDLLDRSDTNNLNIIIDGDDIILAYSESVNADLTEIFYTLQDQTISGDYTQPTTVPPSGQNGQAFPPVDLDLSTTLPNPPLDINGAVVNDAQLKEILVDQGEFELSIRNTYQHTLMVELTIPSIHLNGQVLKFANISVPPGNTVARVQNIANYVVDLKDNTTGVLNSIAVTAKVTGVLDGTRPLVMGDQVIFSLKMKDVSYQHVVGKLGTFTIPLEKGDNNISLFDDIEGDGEFHIETFNFKSTIVTDWGVPLEMSIANLNFFNSNENTTTGVIDGIDNLVSIDALSNVNLVGVEDVVTNTTFTSDQYPDLKKVVGIQPNSFSYDLSFITNPNNNPSENLFLSKESKLETTLEGQFYLHGYLRNFKRNDTLTDIDLSDEETSIVEKAAIRFIVENGMPLELAIDLLFLDENDVVIDQELDKVKIPGAEVDNQGYVTNSVKNTVDIILDEERMMKIGPKVRKIILVSSLDSEGADLSENVHIRPQDKMKIIIGVRATIDQDLN